MREKGGIRQRSGNSQSDLGHCCLLFSKFNFVTWPEEEEEAWKGLFFHSAVFTKGVWLLILSVSLD